MNFMAESRLERTLAESASHGKQNLGLRDKIRIVESRLNPYLRNSFEVAMYAASLSSLKKKHRILDYFLDDRITSILNNLPRDKELSDLVQSIFLLAVKTENELTKEKCIELLKNSKDSKIAGILADGLCVYESYKGPRRRDLYEMTVTPEVLHTIALYKSDVANLVAVGIFNNAINYKDKDKLSRLLKELNSKEVIEALNDNKKEISASIFRILTNRLFISPDAYKAIAKAILDKKFLKACDTVLSECKPFFDYASENIFQTVADFSEDKHTNMVAFLDSPKILSALKRYSWSPQWHVANVLLERAKISVKSAEKLAEILGSDKVFYEVQSLYRRGEYGLIEDIINVIRDCRTKNPYKIPELVKRLEPSKEAMSTLKNAVYTIPYAVRSNIIDLITDIDSLKIAAAYVNSIFTGLKLPKPSKRNIKNYLEVANARIEERHGLKNAVGSLEALLAYSMVGEAPEEPTEFLFAINNAERKNIKFYSPSTKKFVTNCQRENLAKYAVLLLAAPEEAEREGFTQNIFSDETLNLARKELSNIEGLNETIKSLIGSSQYEAAFKHIYEAGNGLLNDVLMLKDFYENGPRKGLLIKAVESNHPLDFDSEAQNACVFLPFGSKRSNILEYCKDPNFLLVRYEILGKPTAAAICYREGDTLLVDSVEGNPSTRLDLYYDIIYADIVERATELGTRYVVFNNDVQGKTGMEFIKHLEKKNPKRATVTLKLDTKGYLEAHKNPNGYILDLGLKEVVEGNRTAAQAIQGDIPLPKAAGAEARLTNVGLENGN